MQTQLKAALSVSFELTMLYWRIGKELSEKIVVEGWGAKVIENIARDLEKAFPGISGFSLRNLRYMRKFAETYTDINFAAAAAKYPGVTIWCFGTRLRICSRKCGMCNKS